MTSNGVSPADTALTTAASSGARRYSGLAGSTASKPGPGFALTESRQSTGMRTTLAPVARMRAIVSSRTRGSSSSASSPSETPRVRPALGNGPTSIALFCAPTNRQWVGGAAIPGAGSTPIGRGGPSGPPREGPGRTGGGCSHTSADKAKPSGRASLTIARWLAMKQDRVARQAEPGAGVAAQRRDQHYLRVLRRLELAAPLRRDLQQKLDRARALSRDH